MCGIQVGKQQVKDMLAHVELADKTKAACGLQIGFEEASQILAHRGAGAVDEAACGLQIGQPATDDIARQMAKPKNQ